MWSKNVVVVGMKFARRRYVMGHPKIANTGKASKVHAVGVGMVPVPC